MKGSPYGIHRVLEPAGTLPQAAWKICNNMEICDNEILIDVDILNIDAASFTQIKKAANMDVENIKATMEEAYREIEKDLPEKYQGKIDNPDQDR